MTHLDPPPRPSCPLCASNEGVARNPNPGPHWLCGDCWTGFAGTQSEWAAMSDARSRWTQLRKNEEAADGA